MPVDLECEIMEKDYVVYEHVFPNNKKYIGITCRPLKQRFKNGYGYVHNKHMMNAIKKYGWKNVKHNILAKNLSKSEAETLEIKLIKKYNLTNRLNGYNIELGGKGANRINEETRAILREKCSGKNNARYGVEVSKETRQKMRLAKLGTKQTEEHRLHISIGEGKPIAQYTIDGKFIKVFHSTRQVKRELGIHNSSACARGECKTSGGYVWRYVDDNML